MLMASLQLERQTVTLERKKFRFFILFEDVGK